MTKDNRRDAIPAHSWDRTHYNQLHRNGTIENSTVANSGETAYLFMRDASKSNSHEQEIFADQKRKDIWVKTAL